jgi:uncharacterized membrane protein YfcA
MLLFLGIGVLAGISAGWFGIGGGTLIVPALVFFAGYTQFQAVGTSLAVLLPPVGALAVWNYYKAGHVDLKVAGLIALGLVLGAWAGSYSALKVDELKVKLAFGLFLAFTGLSMSIGAIRALLAKGA